MWPIESTFARKLESELAPKVRRPVRTVNTGVGSYNTVQEYAVLRTFHDIVQPDIVALLYVSNDVEPNDPPFDPWSERSIQGKSPPETITILVRKSWLCRLGIFASQYSVADSPTAPSKDARGVKESMDALCDIADFCREHSIAFVTFFYRTKSELLAGQSPSLFSDVQNLGQQHGFPVVDVGTWWGDTDLRSVTNSIVDSHPNDRGHQILATGMADFLMENDLVPETAPPSRLER